MTLKLLWGRVITGTFIKGPLCAGHLLEEGTSFKGGLGNTEPVAQMKKLGLSDNENLPKVIENM